MMADKGTAMEQGQTRPKGVETKTCGLKRVWSTSKVLSEPSLNGLPNLDWRRRISLSSVAVEESSESEEPPVEEHGVVL